MPKMDKNDPKVIELSGQLNALLGTHDAKRRIPPRWGLHDDVPAHEYHDWDAFGSGSVRKIGHSPAHFIDSWKRGSEIKPEMITGSAFHACVLEPDTEWLLYQQLPEGRDRRHKEYKEMAEEYGPDYVLTAREYASCIGGRDSLHQHSRLSRLLEAGRAELSFAWKDTDTDIPLKGRADWVNEHVATVLDLKHTGDAREQAFRRVAKSMDYPTQGAQYIEGLTQQGMEVKHYAIVAVEVDPPYGVMLYRLATADMIIAEGHWRSLVDRIAWCIENEEWPGYEERTTVLHMGPYWEADIQEEIATIEESMR